MTDNLFPMWQVDRQEYEAVCAYLGLVPIASVHARLNAYLGEAPFRFPAPRGFSRFLARPRLTRFRVARLDLATRLIDRGHPARHVLNAVIALHECDPGGYAQMSASPTGTRLLPSLAVWGLGFVVSLAVTLPWLAMQFIRYVPTAMRAGPIDLHGKRILIIGAARGLGLDLMLECLERGGEIVGTVRSDASRDELRTMLPNAARARMLVCDLSKAGSPIAALTEAQIDPCSLALVIYCAGVKHDGASVLSMAELRDTFAVNFFAAADLAGWLCATDNFGGAKRTATPAIGACHSKDASGPPPLTGTALVLVSSMGRWHGMHSSAGYNASKAALSIWGESLEMELRLAGLARISVMTVEPGLFESGMTRSAGMARFLFVSRRKLASSIVDGALAGKRVLRRPFWFALLTWAICLAGRKWRLLLLARAKSGRHVAR